MVWNRSFIYEESDTSKMHILRFRLHDTNSLLDLTTSGANVEHELAWIDERPPIKIRLNMRCEATKDVMYRHELHLSRHEKAVYLLRSGSCCMYIHRDDFKTQLAWFLFELADIYKYINI